MSREKSIFFVWYSVAAATKMVLVLVAELSLKVMHGGNMPRAQIVSKSTKP